MKRNLKVLGLAIVAALALTAMAASAAQANDAGKFTAESYPGTVNGLDTGTHEFTAAGGAVNCTHATFSGTGTEASTTQTITPVYEGCTAFGFVGATVTMNGCDYLFHLGGTVYTTHTVTNEKGEEEEVEVSRGFYKGTVDLVCPSGKEITIDAGPCTIHIPGQNGLGSVTFTNGTSGGKTDITNHANVTGITGTLTKNNFLCFFTAGHFTNGTYTGTTTITGKNNLGNPQGIDIG